MARKSRSSIKRPIKEVFCFIVEGFTEKNYIGRLKGLYRKSGKIENCEGGSAGGVLEKAEKCIERNRDKFSGYIIWFDSDKYSPSDDSNLKNQLEARKNVEIYISKPCIENWLLAHFQTISIYQDKCESCIKDLKIYIPNYKKNDCLLLEKYITQENIEIAIKNYPIIGQIPEKYFKNQA